MQLIKKSFGFIKEQLTQGTDPQGISRSFAVGTVIAILPVLGATTALCVAVGAKLRLNQPLLQAINYLLYPLQLALLPVFLMVAARVAGIEGLSFVPTDMIKQFSASPRDFMALYGLVGIYAVLVWSVVAPLVYLGVRMLVFRIASRAQSAQRGK